jgi:Na+-translocating ferredoxin:NAD+ oxidoreductase RnfG subunit
MKRSLFALLMSIVLLAREPALGARVYLREADAPRAIFPESTGVTRGVLELSDEELASVSKLLGRKVEVRSYPYLEVRNDERTVGFIFLFDVIGQSLPITFAVGVTPDGVLRDVSVMVYREPQGEAISEKRFRKQFVGKQLADSITLGKDIDAISGATISSRSATFAARKGLALAHVLRVRGARPMRGTIVRARTRR